MKKLKISSAELVESARAKIKEVETADAIKMVGDPNIVLVDIRDVRERQRVGYIPGSYHCPRGMAEFWVDPESPYYKEIFGEDKTFVLYCGSGWRSALTALQLNEMGFDCAHVKEGFSTWEKHGGPVEFPDHDKR